MLRITDKDFKTEVSQSAIPVLVDFFAEWCGPCKMATPVLEKLAEEYQGKLKIAKLDVDQNPQAVQKYGVMSVPTVIVFKGGKEVKRGIGFPGEEGYKKLIEEVLKSK